MIKIFFLFILSVLLFSCAVTKSSDQVYFESIKANHKSIAILPAVVFIRANQNQQLQLNQDDLNEASLKLGFMLQNELYERLKNKKYGIDIQDIKVSNNKLFSAGLPFEQFKTMRMDTLARMLGVDVVIYTNTDLSKISQKDFDIWIGIGSTTAFLAGAALTGLSLATSKEYLEDKIEVSYSVIEPMTNKIIWQQKFNTAGMSSPSLESFFKNSIKQTIKIFPYKK